MDSEQTLRKILTKRTKLENVDLDQPISSLGLDSLDLVEVMLEIEEELGVSFTSDEIGNVSTLRDVKDLVDSKIQNK